VRIIAPGAWAGVSRRRTLWFGWTLAVIAMAGFARLGFWQYARMQEKEALLARVAHALNDRQPHALDSEVTGIAWVDGDGVIDPRTLLLDNQIRDGRPGVHVYCIVGTGRAAGHRLVDFGWLPLAGDRQLPDATCPAGPMHVQGLATPPPSSGVRMGDAMQPAGPGRWLMTRVDVDAIAKAFNMRLPASVIRLDPKLPGGYTRDLNILPNTLPPERHLGYAVQWWALALAVFVTALLLTFRPRLRKTARP
jgi:cytochrome oxidase assembly protein ShyY1